jgi:hypothetical protein
MPVLDGRQSRPDFDNPSKDDRKNTEDRPRPLRVRPDHYEKHGKKHYEKNKAYYIAKAAERRKKYQKAWVEYKSKLSCQHCGENHPATFDFHHVERGPENVKIFQLIKNGSYKKVYEELKKCVVLCANCHRKLHYEEEQAKKDPT